MSRNTWTSPPSGWCSWEASPRAPPGWRSRPASSASTRRESPVERSTSTRCLRQSPPTASWCEPPSTRRTSWATTTPRTSLPRSPAAPTSGCGSWRHTSSRTSRHRAVALPPLTEALQPPLELLDGALHEEARLRRAGPEGRRPVQVLYGGAPLFHSISVARMGALARAAMETHAPDGATFAHALGLSLTPTQSTDLRARVLSKLSREPVEDLRIDFEDGYGVRPDAEEDAHADAVGVALREAQRASALPPFIGVRLKPLAGRSARRALRTLERVGAGLGPEPIPGLALTLPKVSVPAQVELLRRAAEALEHRLGWPAGAVALELMVEMPATVISRDGRLAIPGLVEAAGGRWRSAHVRP